MKLVAFLSALTIAAAPAAAAESAAWWSRMSDPLLAGLVETGLADSPTMKVATARVAAARAAAREKTADRLPLLGVGGGAIEADSGDARLGAIDASWEIDLFGRNASGARAARAHRASVEAERDDARVRLSAEIATRYISLREQQLYQTGAERMLELSTEIGAITSQRFGAGTASAIDTARTRADIAHLSQELRKIRARIDDEKGLLALLVGKAPGGLDALLDDPAAIPAPPAEVPIADPSPLLRQRPDVRAAERRLEECRARLGVARAARFPTIRLFGLLGFTDIDATPDSSAAIIPTLQWSFLDFGRTAARIGEARARLEAAEAEHDAAILGALQDADAALKRYGHARQVALRASETLRARREIATLVGQRERAGTASRRDRIVADQEAWIAEGALYGAQADLARSWILIQKSLGLGWEAHSDARPAH